MHNRRNFVQQMPQVPSHRVPHHDVNAAAHEHAAAFHVYGTNREAEQHDAEDEPRRAFADGLFGDATRIKGGGGEVTEDNRRTPPE
jgi:hypothetical protein